MAWRLAALARCLFGLAVGALLATACVRTEPPTEFICSTADDCSEGETCFSGRCRVRGYCGSDYDCDRARQTCRAERCLDVECTYSNASSCGSYRCDFETFTCYRACTEDSQCQSDFYCDQGQCIPGVRPFENGAVCSEDAQCQSGVCCARSSGKVCTDRCEPAGATCRDARDCKDAYCCARFANDSVCSSAPCLTVSTCASDGDCKDGQLCDAGRCLEKLTNGKSCTDNRECVSGRCAYGQCLAQLGDPCEEASDCALEQTCCVLAEGKGRECAAASAFCLGETGDACEFDLECAGGRCQDGLFCSKPCVDSTECGTGPFGIANVCVAGFAEALCYPGCTTAAQCQSIFDPFDSFCATDGARRFCDLY